MVCSIYKRNVVSIESTKRFTVKEDVYVQYRVGVCKKVR